MWFSDLLVEYVHYVPVKSDLSDIIDIINWCIKNDKKCKEIAKNAHDLFQKSLLKDGLFDYMKSQLNMIHNNRVKNDKLLGLDLNLTLTKKKKNIAIISVYRDNGNGERKRELNIFIKLMEQLMEPYCNFKIFIIEQSDDGELFNIGKLKNIGFHIANSMKNSQFDNYIFSDIDTIPDYDLMPYLLGGFKYPIALAIRGTRYMNANGGEGNGKGNGKDKIFLGALLGFDGVLFEKINGYPNNIYGWGGEDFMLEGRILNSGIGTIYYPKKGSIIDLEETVEMKTINIVKEKTSIVKKEMLKYEKMYEDLKSWKDNGLSNLNYKVIENKNLLDNVFLIKVDLKKKDDIKKYPHLFEFDNKNKHNKLSNEVKNHFKKLKYEYV